MACTIGRVSLPQSPRSIKRQGDGLIVSGEFAVTPATGQMYADQLSGYGVHNADEPAVAFTYDASIISGGLDGMYWITATEVDYVKLATGVFSWQARLVEVPDKFSPQVELLVGGATRDNAHSATGIKWFAVPGTIDAPPAFSSVTATATVTLSDANTVTLYQTSATGGALYSPTPATFYYGACRVEVSPDSGSTWQTVVGRQISDEATWWRLTNGRTRVTGQASMGLRVETWDGAAWDATDFKVGTYSAGFTTTGAWSAPSVLWNRPEMCSLRVSWPGQTSYVDLTIRRGSHIVEGYILNRNTTAAFAVYRAASESATSITGGIEATAADANGNKFTLLSPAACTKITTGASGIYLTIPYSAMPFAVANLQGSSPFTPSGMYWFAAEHDQSVVAR